MLEAIKPYTLAIKIGAAIALLAGSFAFGHYVAAKSDEVDALQLAKTNLEALNAQKTKVSDLELALQESQAKTVEEYQRGKREAEDSANATIADYKSGNLRLRKQLQCTSKLLRNLPDSSASGQLTIPEGQCGLSTEDVEFLVRFSQRTNDLKNKANSLIDQYNDAKAKIDQFNKESKNAFN